MHISDIHCYAKEPVNQITPVLQSLCEYITSANISVDELFVTGDYRSATDPNSDNFKTAAETAAASIRKIAESARIDINGDGWEKHIHLVPGNHDVTLKTGDEIFKKKRNDIYSKYKKNRKITADDREFLKTSCEFYNCVLRTLYTDDGGKYAESIICGMKKNPHMAVVYDDYNLISLNTSWLELGGGSNNSLFLDEDYIANCINNLGDSGKHKPTIILAHHSMNWLEKNERSFFSKKLNDLAFPIYLCGHKHTSCITISSGICNIICGSLDRDMEWDTSVLVGEIDVHCGLLRIQSHTYMDDGYWCKSDNVIFENPYDLKSIHGEMEPEPDGSSEKQAIIIDSVVKLMSINGNLSAYYKITEDIDLGDSSNWIPIGTQDTPFTGHIDGGYHTISNLTIDRQKDNQGLFGYARGATIQNINLKSVNISGKDHLGSLVGYAQDSSISNCHCGESELGTNDVHGKNIVGGLLGGIKHSSISGCYFRGSVSGIEKVGGCLGEAYTDSSVSQCYSTISVSGHKFVGGFVGWVDFRSSISKCYAKCPETKNVQGQQNIGGFAGAAHWWSSISECYATGSVSGNITVGGFIGSLLVSSISSSYSNGSVNGDQIVGGFVGDVGNFSEVSFCYTTNEVLSENGAFFAGKIDDIRVYVLKFLTINNNSKSHNKLKIIGNILDMSGYPNIYVADDVNACEDGHQRIPRSSIINTFPSEIWRDFDREIWKSNEESNNGLPIHRRCQYYT